MGPLALVGGNIDPARRDGLQTISLTISLTISPLMISRVVLAWSRRANVDPRFFAHFDLNATLGLRIVDGPWQRQIVGNHSNHVLANRDALEAEAAFGVGARGVAVVEGDGDVRGGALCG